MAGKPNKNKDEANTNWLNETDFFIADFLRLID